MRGLADALEEERRRQALAARSAALLASAGARSGPASGEELARRTRFAGGVARIAQDAAAARGDALRQTEWQAGQLAAAEARVRRLAELEIAAASALAAARHHAAAPLPAARARRLPERAAAPLPAAMARDLQKPG
jgi:hypothetical protein